MLIFPGLLRVKTEVLKFCCLQRRAITDPFDVHEPGSSQTVEFYGYGAKLSKIEATSCFKQALNIAIIEHHGAAVPMGTDAITYSSFSNNVFLTLIPRDTMTWKMWSEAVCSLVSFMMDDVDREWQFIILEEGYEGEVGYGSLYQRSKTLDMVELPSDTILS